MQRTALAVSPPCSQGRWGGSPQRSGPSCAKASKAQRTLVPLMTIQEKLWFHDHHGCARARVPLCLWIPVWDGHRYDPCPHLQVCSPGSCLLGAGVGGARAHARPLSAAASERPGLQASCPFKLIPPTGRPHVSFSCSFWALPSSAGRPSQPRVVEPVHKPPGQTILKTDSCVSQGVLANPGPTAPADLTGHHFHLFPVSCLLLPGLLPDEHTREPLLRAQLMCPVPARFSGDKHPPAGREGPPLGRAA